MTAVGSQHGCVKFDLFAMAACMLKLSYGINAIHCMPKHYIPQPSNQVSWTLQGKITEKLPGLKD